MSDNFFNLLELDPSVDDWAVIEASILEHRRSWSLLKNQGAPSAKRKAERYLKLIPEIEAALRDPVQRRSIASAAKEELESQTAQQLAKLDQLITMIREQTVGPDEVKLLAREAGGGITEAVVTQRLKTRGISVDADRTVKKSARFRPKLELSIVKSIKDNLGHLRKDSLYDFLAMSPRSSPKSLYDAADEIYKEIRRKGLTDPDSTARQELAGHCKAIFKDRQEKERYDNSYSVEAMEGLNSHLELAGRDGFLDQQEIENIVREARGLGVALEIAMEYIEDYAGKRKWPLQRSNELPSLHLKLCGFCSTLARTAQETRCHNCGKELVQPCPRCTRPTATQDECCGNCGCSTGDAPLVQGWLHEGQEHLTRGDTYSAIVCFDRALLCWENWEPAQKAKAQAEKLRLRRDQTLEAVETLARARKLEEAQGALDRFRREFGGTGTEALAGRINAGIACAAETFSAALALYSSGKINSAIEKYSEALGHCIDHQPTLRALAACPPPAPAALDVVLKGATALLSWKPAPARGLIMYRVQRKTSSVPTSVEDGTQICDIPSLNWKDTTIPPGLPFYYSVFALRGKVASLTGANSGPYIHLADVTGIAIEAGDSQLSLRWTKPPACKNVEVWREIGSPPTSPGRGTRVPTSGETAVDQGLANGSTYGYLLVSVFEDPRDGRGVLRSPGVAVVATPVEPPPKIADLHARREERTVFLEWTPPRRGEVQIRQCSRLPNTSPGEVIALATAISFGLPVQVTGRGTAQATLDGQGRVYFVPLSVVVETAVVGVPIDVKMLDEVTNLEAQRQGNTIQLTWMWPKGAIEVLIVWRHDAFPRVPEEVGERRSLSRTEYEHAGLWELRNAPRLRHYFTVFVQGQEADLYSAGSQVLEASGLEAEVTYKVVTKRGVFSRSLKEAWIELRTRDLQRLPALQAVLKQGLPPARREDGRVVVDIDSLEFVSGFARIGLPPQEASGFVKLFFNDGQNARGIRLIPAAIDQLKIG